MGIYFEALILYILLFFSVQTGLFTGMATGTEFSVTAELTKIFLYYLPSLALIWYLLFKVHKTKISAIKPGKKDLVLGLIILPCLLLIGFTVTLVSITTSGTTTQIALYSPSTVPGWIILCLTCICAAYLEESFFRFYLLSKREELNLNGASALILSVILFCSIHIYGGLWSILNAAICGTFLGLIFLRYKIFHGIAIAHALYNISAFAINALNI